VPDRIEVASAGEQHYAVTLRSGGQKTVHQVAVPSRLLEDLAVGPEDEARLVRVSFEFLLEREPPASILRTFDLDVIGRYFPEYTGAMRSRLGPGGPS
jgi:hypothetical protein